MTATDSERIAYPPLFEIKGGSINLPILKLLSADAAAIAALLQEKVKQAPDFFRNAPVVIDLHDLLAPEPSLDFVRLVRVLRDCGLVPVGVRGGSENLHRAAQKAELAILADTKHEPVHHQTPPSSPTPPTAPVHAEPIGGKLIEHQIRSGQRIYAPGGDLVIVAPVSAGAEIMADGNIHVYGALRGRALAGVQGNLNSRIFCMDLQAELIAIGGHYKVSENLDDSVRNKPVQIFFRDNTLIIEDL